MAKLLCWVGKGLWVLSVVALVLAWVAVFTRGLILGLEPLAWYWNALVFAVLSLGADKLGGKGGFEGPSV